MSHKIFTSQSNLENGRGRFKRRLDAIMDSQNSILETPIKKQNSDTLEEMYSKPNILNTLLTPQEPLLFCEYLGNPCQNKVCFQNTDKYNYCRVRKFKDKFGDDYLNIGAMSIEDVKRLR